ncbi:hypothetical protein [Pleurocapsa sp. FMAR1]|uniref:hypothetical protein n=1 Tax=Pleurocapsa sp. FMAR1 TaxID=3040204 RepID=UPI0029C6A28A|nr:hypothetical protein [Pleurocapsa sp. FMAR1]
MIKNEELTLPDANEILFRALKEGWNPTDFQKERLMEAGLYSFDAAIREKLAEINFFKRITYNIPRNSNRIQFFNRGEMIWEEQIAELLKVSNRGLIEMYKFKVRQYQENLKQLGLIS